jgi:hypothetical protein
MALDSQTGKLQERRAGKGEKHVPDVCRGPALVFRTKR